MAITYRRHSPPGWWSRKHHQHLLNGGSFTNVEPRSKGPIPFPLVQKPVRKVQAVNRGK